MGVWMSDQEIEAVGTFSKQRDALIIEVADLTHQKETLEKDTKTIFDNANTAKTETSMAKQKLEQTLTDIEVAKAVDNEQRNSLKKEIEVLTNTRDSKLSDIQLISEALEKSTQVIGHLTESVESVRSHADEARKDIVSAVNTFKDTVVPLAGLVGDVIESLSWADKKIIDKMIEADKKVMKLTEYENTLKAKENEINSLYNRMLEEFEAKKKELGIK